MPACRVDSSGWLCHSCHCRVSTRSHAYSLDRSVSKGPRANNCHRPRLALIRHRARPPLEPPLTQILVENLQRTFYGEQWQFGAGGDDDPGSDQEDMMEFSDTAYTTHEIGVHNDGTYFSQPPGIQVPPKWIIIVVVILYYAVYRQHTSTNS